MKKIFIIVSVFIGVNLNAQTQTQNLDMGLYQLQFPSANGGNNRIQSFGGTFPGEWLFKSRFDDIYIDAGENSSNTYKILFLTGGIERARIKNNSYFGISTDHPDSPLSIGYNYGLSQLAMERLDGAETFTMNINSSNQIDFVNKSGGGDYNFKTNIVGEGISSVLFVEGTNGNIGIGTTNPDSPLSIGYNSGLSQLAMERLDGAETFLLNINSSNHVVFTNKSGGGDYDFKTNIGGQAISSALFIEGSNGNIGIGTTSPDAKLAVNGNIHTKEVKIDLVGWPDYVFEKEYTLPTLEEVEVHIEEKGHLQNIPSAKEVEQNGVKLGEINSKLLQKIEELMLYTIQQEKKIKAMEKQLEKVQSYLKTN